MPGFMENWCLHVLSRCEQELTTVLSLTSFTFVQVVWGFMFLALHRSPVLMDSPTYVTILWHIAKIYLCSPFLIFENG